MKIYLFLLAIFWRRITHWSAKYSLTEKKNQNLPSVNVNILRSEIMIWRIRHYIVFTQYIYHSFYLLYYCNIRYVVLSFDEIKTLIILLLLQIFVPPGQFLGLYMRYLPAKLPFTSHRARLFRILFVYVGNMGKFKGRL